MKHVCLLVTLALGVQFSFAQALFTYGNSQVSKEEFLRAYNKNKTPVTDKEKSLKEYLDLYSKFKLKVQAAKVLQLDTLQQLKYDIQNFRSQVEESYMNDEKGIESLVNEAVVRSQKDIHLIHYYISINSKMTPEDTVKAYKAMEDVAAELKKGKANDDKIVEKTGKQINPVQQKDLGYITALSLPYEIENMLYELKPGEITRIYRTKSALHIFKNAGERKSAGKWKIAQILLAVPPDATADKIQASKILADSLYKVLKAGANFAELAKKYSDDKITYLNAGEMPEFGTGKFELPFENKVFALKEDGDISEPIFTGYGFHIVKRLQQRPTPADKTDEAFVYSLKQQILQDGRMKIPKGSFIKEVMVKSGFKRNTAVKDAQLFRYADSVSENKTVGNFPINKTTIFSFTKSTVKGSDWLNFVKDYKLNTDVYKGENNKELLEKYFATTAQEYYRQHLEEFNEEFKYQMQEFKEGNMLFEIMERNVWSKAAGDSAGLHNYYNQHKEKYKWAESALVYLYNSNSEATAQQALTDLQSAQYNLATGWRKIAEDSDGKIQADSGRYELAQIQSPEGTTLSEGMTTKPLINSSDMTASFVKVLKLFPANQQRSFEEAKGLVINDFQNYLEEQWIAELKKQHPVKVNEVVFKSLLQ